MKRKSLEERIQRMEDIHDVNTLINKYEYKLSKGLYQEAAECFALKTPGVRAELGPWGVYEGAEGIIRLYPGVHKRLQLDPKTGKQIPGTLFVQANTTPIVEIAGDGKTAKGLWICCGHNTIPTGNDGRQARWFWANRAADFIKEDGKWKIWHYRVYGMIDTPYDQSWVDYKETGPVADFAKTCPDDLKPDKPTTYHWIYSKNAIWEYIPPSPEPYETFSDEIAY